MKKLLLARSSLPEATANRLLDGATVLLFGVILWLFCSGCAFHDRVYGPSFQPRNVFQEDPTLPATLKRVAILPVAWDEQQALQEDGREQLGPVLREELLRLGKFEVVPVSSEDLNRWTGRNTWTGEEQLPMNFFDVLRARLGCDAVLFASLTVYRPYKPMAVGWRFKLVDTRSMKIRWAADEVFNAGEREISNAARRYYQQNLKTLGSLSDSKMILSSPSGFGRYTARALFETMPQRSLN